MTLSLVQIFLQKIDENYCVEIVSHIIIVTGV